jgi:hypothetical protein
MSHIRFDCAVQLPLQLAWQPAMQLTVGSVPEQDTLQRALMLAWHSAVHVSMSLLPMQADVQLPIASASHDPWQSKPPLVEQLAMQEAWQLVLQLASMPPVQPPMHPTSSCAEHAALKLRLWQDASQLMLGGDMLQLAVELISAPPQSGRNEAWAEPVKKVTAAAAARVAKAESERRKVMAFLPRGLDGGRPSSSQRSFSRFELHWLSQNG